MSTRSGKNYKQGGTMAAPVGWQDLMQFMMQESEARREETAQHRLEMVERE